eukprot:UN17384
MYAMEIMKQSHSVSWDWSKYVTPEHMKKGLFSIDFSTMKILQASSVEANFIFTNGAHTEKSHETLNNVLLNLVNYLFPNKELLGFAKYGATNYQLGIKLGSEGAFS